MTRPTHPRRRFALLDRDGTIIVDKVYLQNPADIEFVPGVLEGLLLLRNAGFKFVLVTNQSGIARGYFDEATLATVHRRLEDMLAAVGLRLEAIYFCPHGPGDGCGCRKPAQGMVNDAMRDLGFGSDEAVLIGDSDADMAAAAAVGIPGIWIVPPDRPALEDAAVDFLEAARRALDHFGVREIWRPTCM